MPQELNVLCCCKCNMFQVHIVKKAKKWQCKICNEKQSFQRVYFQGSGKDCRIHVQQLNSLNRLDETKVYVEQNDSANNSLKEAQKLVEVSAAESKWSKFLESSEEDESNTHANVRKEDLSEYCALNVQAHNLHSHENALSNDHDNNVSGEDKCHNDLHHVPNENEVRLQKFSASIEGVRNIFEDTDDIDDSLDF